METLDDIQWRAMTQDELLELLQEVDEPVNPYNAVGGIVRMIAVDRWLNQLDAQGFLEVTSYDPLLVMAKRGYPG